MKNTQKKKITRGYHLLTKNCLHVTVLTARRTLQTRFLTLLRHNVTMTSMAVVTRRHANTFSRFNFRQQMVTSRYFLFLQIFHLPCSFNSTSFYLGWSLNAQQGLKWRLPRQSWPYWQKRSVSPKQQDNGKQGNFERFVQGQYTLDEKCFSRNEMYIPPVSDSSL